MNKNTLAKPVRRLLVLAILSLLLTGVGCNSVLFTLAYIFKGPDTDPKYNYLKKGELKVVVVCRSVMMNQFQSETVPRDLTRQVSKLLKANVKNKKLTVADHRKVEEWLDDCNNNFEEFDEVGVAMKADYVIGIELQSFQLQESPNTLQGKARWVVKTYDMKKDELVAEDTMTIVFPPSVPAQLQDNSSIATFRIQFVDIIAKQIAALYHPHDHNKVYNPMDADCLAMH